MAIITISRQFGSLGAFIAKELAKRLEYRFLDKQGIGDLLTEYGLSKMKFEKYDEKKPTFWDNFSSDREKFLNFMRTAVYDFASGGNAVIMGRGSQIVLAGVPATLRLRFISPMDVRVERLSKRFGGDKKSAEAMARQSDRDRTGFHRFFFDVNWELPGYYDLTINTSLISIEKSVDLIAASLDVLETDQQLEQAAGRIADLQLGQLIVNTVLYDHMLHVSLFNADVKAGNVVLKGSVTSSADIARVEDAAKEIEGVKSVTNELVFMDNYSPIY